MKRHISLVLIMLLIFTSITITYGEQKDVLTESIDKVYTAKDIGSTVISNIGFSDLAPTHWAKEPVSRMGALDIIKGGGNGLFYPSNQVTKEQALAFLLRAAGLEEEAIAEAERLAQNNPTNQGLLDSWSRGYMQVARNYNMLTAAQYQDSIANDQSQLDFATSFIRTSSVSREQVAKWIVQAVGILSPELMPPVYQQQAILSYRDYQNIGAEYAPYVEAVTRNRIMTGNNNNFNPKGALTRAEMAQILKNMDQILYGTMNIVSKSGTIATITENYFNQSIYTRSLYVRTTEGKVDQLNYQYSRNTTGFISIKDAPVYRGGSIQSMYTLQEGEAIEYLVDGTTNEILYIYSKGSSQEIQVTGTLEPLTAVSQGQISIKGENGGIYTYIMKASLYNAAEGSIRIGYNYYTNTTAPVSQKVALTLQNGLVIDIQTLGSPVVSNEISGIVKENNTKLAYITIIDWNGKEITKYYQANKIVVEKQNYYDEYDEIGYLDEMFPDYRFDPRDANIDAVEAGDIVHIKIDPATGYASAISAKTNYVVKYATVKSFAYKGAEGISATLVLHDNSTVTYDISGQIPVIKNNKNVGALAITEGDSVKLLVNQAVVKPGTISETVKEVVIEGYGQSIANIYKGQLGKVDETQRKLTLTNIYTLNKNGWSNYSTAKDLSISGNNIEYYNGGQQISLDYAKKFLTGDDISVYVVTSNYYGTEKVVKVAFRSERDSVLPYTNVSYSNGINQFKLLNEASDIAMDSGTLIVKNGKLVSASSVIAPDYAHVVLNGNKQAAVIWIEPEPNNDATSVFRGRIASITDNQSFQVQSHAVLKDMTWIYSPIERIFTISHDTTIIGPDGIIPLSEFISYSEISKVDEVYTIIAEGTKAKYIIDQPYAKEGVSGIIYNNAEGTIMIRDVYVYSSATQQWKALSLKNSYASINLEQAVIIKNNEIVSQNELVEGDKIRIMTDENLENKLLTTSDRSVNGYIIFVEK